MSVVRLDKFSGMLPAWDDTLIPQNQSAYALNTYLYSGLAKGWRMPTALHTLDNPLAKYAFRIPTTTKGFAKAYLVFTSNPNALDTVLLGEALYTFVTAIEGVSNTAYSVKLGATATETRDNMLAAITGGDGLLTVYSDGTCANVNVAVDENEEGNEAGTVTVDGNPGIFCPAVDYGAVYNDLLVAESTNLARMRWVSDSASIASVTGTFLGGADISGDSTITGTSEWLEFVDPDAKVVRSPVSDDRFLRYYWTEKDEPPRYNTYERIKNGDDPWLLGVPAPNCPPEITAAGGSNDGTVTLGYEVSGDATAPAPDPADTAVLYDERKVEAGTIFLVPVSVINKKLSLVNVHCMPTRTNGAVVLTAVMYDDAAGVPGNLLAVSSNTVGVTEAELTTVWFTSGQFGATGMDPTVQYWAGFLVTGDDLWLHMSDQTTAVGVRFPAAAAPVVAPAVTGSQDDWQVWGTALATVFTLSVTGGYEVQQVGFPTASDDPGADPDTGGTATTPTTAPTEGSPGHTFLVRITIDDVSSAQIDTVNTTAAQTDTTARLIGVVYSDNGGRPNTLLGQGSEVEGITSGTDISSTFEVPLVLPAGDGVYYWIGFMVLASSLIIQTSTNGDNLGVTWTNAANDTPDSPAPSDITTGEPTYQIFANFNMQGIIVARAYVYTYVSAYDEEGPPSPPGKLTGWSNSIYTVRCAPPESSDRGVEGFRTLTKIRLYRTVSSAAGVTSYFFLEELDITPWPAATSTINHTDRTTDDAIIASNMLASTLWQPPPDGLQGLITLPNGMVAGFRGNEIWFCEPFRPHAWPPTYVLTTEFPIVGLGAAGQAVVAVTSGYPSVAYGVRPDQMNQIKVRINEPCVSAGSIVSTGVGVYYASVNGLIFVDATGGGLNTTLSWISRERWHELTPPSGIRATRIGSEYVAFGDDDVDEQGFTIELSADAQSFSILPSPGGHRIGFGKLTGPGDVLVDNLFTDFWSGNAMVIQAGVVNYYDFTDETPDIQPFIWRSKKFQDVFKQNFEAMKVYFNIPAGSPTLNPTRYTANNMTLAADMYGLVRVYADDTLVVARELRTSGELLRIPSGFKADLWWLEIEARVDISNLQFATSVTELGRV